MAMVPLLAFPKVNRSATVYDRSIDRRCFFRDSALAISRVCTGTVKKDNDCGETRPEILQVLAEQSYQEIASLVGIPNPDSEGGVGATTRGDPICDPEASVPNIHEV